MVGVYAEHARAFLLVLAILFTFQVLLAVVVVLLLRIAFFPSAAQA